MYGKEAKYYKKSKPNDEYEFYSQSETSLGSSLWEYSDDPKEKRRVKFDTDYDYSSQDNYYGGRQKNSQSYTYLYDPNNMYETGDEIDDYYSEDSQYTQYHQSPQQIMYTGTDSAFTTGDSDYENSDFGYQQKKKHNYSHGYKKKNNVPTRTRDIEASSLGKDLKVYLAQQPGYQAFKYREPTKEEVSVLSEPEFQGGSDTESDGESDYNTDDKGKPSYQIYVANLGKNETSGAFKEKMPKNSQEMFDKGKQPRLQIYATNLGKDETSGSFKKKVPQAQNSQEMLISVTNYDNIPMLAFKTKNSNDLPQKSSSTIVYLPVIVTDRQNEENNLTSKNTDNQLFSNKNTEKAEKPVESIKVYAALNTGQKNIFENSQNKNHENTQHFHKTPGNEQQTSTALKGNNTESKTNRVSKNKSQKSDLRPVSKHSKISYTYLPSILRLHGTKNSEIQRNKTESKTNRVSKSNNQKSDLRPVSKHSKTSYTYLPSMLKMSRDKNRESSKSPVIQTSQPNLSQKEIKNNRSNISRTSGKNVVSVLLGRSTPKAEINNEEKIPSRISRKETQDMKSLKRNNSFYDYEDKKGISQPKSNTSNTSQKSSTPRKRSNSSSISRKSRGHKTINSRPNSKVRLLLGESPPGSEKGSSYYYAAHERELKSKKEEAYRKSKISQGKQETNPSSNWGSSGSGEVRSVSKRPDESKLSTSKISKASNKKTNKSSEILTQSKLAPNARLKTNPSVVKTDESEVVLLAEPINNYEIKTDLSTLTLAESETKNKRQSLAKQSTIKPQEKSGSAVVVGTSTTNKKSVLSKVPDDAYKKEADIKAKSFGNESDKIRAYDSKKENGSKPNLAKENTSVREVDVSQKQSVIKNQDSNKITEHSDIEGSKHESQPLYQNKPIQGSSISMTRKSTTSRNTKTSPQKSIVNIQGNDTLTEQDKNQTVQGSKKSLVKKSTVIEETKPFSKTNSAQKQDSNALVKQDEIGEIKSKSQLLDPNQTLQGFRKSLVKENRQFEETKPFSQNNIVKNQKIEIKDNQQELGGLKRNQSQEAAAAEEAKSILHKKSQIQEYQSKEKINEDKKSVVKETTSTADKIKSTGRRKSQIFQQQSRQKINEEIKNSFVKSETTGARGNNEEIKNSFVKSETTGARGKGSSITQIQPTVSERKSKTNEVRDNNKKEQTETKSNGMKTPNTDKNESFVAEKGIKEGSSVGLKRLDVPGNEKNQKSFTEVNNRPQKTLNSEEKTTIQEKQSSKVNRNNDQVGKQIPTDKTFKDNNTAEDNKTDKSFQRKIPEKKSTQSKRVSNKKEASRVKQISKETKIKKTDYFFDSSMKLWGHDFSTLINYCFQITQFILGVSTYDKFVEVLGNFH